MTASSLRVVDLTIDQEDLITEAARLLHGAFLNRTRAWQNPASARQEVLDSLSSGRVSRAALDESGRVAGWIGGIPTYDGHVWEIHPLVVAPPARRQGVGRSLVEDLERIVRARGAFTLWVGSDDENGETSLSGANLYADVPGAIRAIRNLAGHPYEFYVRIGFTIVGVVPDANGPGKPDILLAKAVG